MILLTGAHCPKCNDIKRFLDKRGMLENIQQVDVNSEYGNVLIEKYDIDRVPAFIDQGKVKYFLKDILK